MPKRLAQALIEAGMSHHDSGGISGAANTAGQLGFGGLGTIGSQLLGTNNGDILGSLGIGGGGGVTSNFNAVNPGITTQQFQPLIGNLYNQQQDVFNQQNNLAKQLLAQSQGGGPNPALDQLHQTTAQNVANQGALMASQRGSNANPALLARQAAMVGASTQQQAAGQAATLRSQQQLGAEQALQGQQANMGNQALQGQSILQGGQAAQNTAITTGQLGSQNINANTAAQNAATHGGILGGALGGAGAAIGGLLNKGGVVKKMAEGGPVNDNIGIANYSSPTAIDPVPFHPYPSGGQGLMSGMSGLGSGLGGLLGGGAAAGGGGALMAGGAGDAIAEVAPLALAANKGARIPFSRALLQGGNVPGKASVQGNSKENDTVPTLLSPGEIVLPRSVTEAPDMESKVMEFLKHLKKKKGSYEDVALAKKACGGRV